MDWRILETINWMSNVKSSALQYVMLKRKLLGKNPIICMSMSCMEFVNIRD